jgi:alcohol dehydrogenase class IV
MTIPTTAGTGTEVTRNAVLTSPEHRTKVSLRSVHMLPAVALVDPHLTDTLPPDVTATTGLDALTQLVEPYVSNRANPLIDPICRDGLQRVTRSLRRAVADGFDKAARDDMALAALFGGLALANAGLGAVHGFAAPVGGMFGAPHGAVCGCLLPHVMAANVTALQAREPESETLTRYRELAQILTGSTGATIADGIAWVQELCTDLSIPRLADFGIAEKDFPAIIEKAAVSSSMQKNPLQLTTDELAEVLAKAH